MPTRDFTGIALELALRTAGHLAPRLSHVGAALGREEGDLARIELDPPVAAHIRFDAPSIDGYSFFLLDCTRTDDGEFRLIEANGSNAALTSSVLGRDDRRSHHMALAFNSMRKPPGAVVALLTHQQGFLHIAEFFGRAAIFAEHLTEMHKVRLCNIHEALGEEDVSVVCGSIAEVAPLVERRGRALYYQSRPVRFGANPNLLPELVRLGVVDCVDGIHNIDDTIFHEGPCTPIVHDKGLQQDLAAGTQIRPLRWNLAHNREEALTAISAFRRAGEVAVGKMNAGSGGAGIEFFTPDMSDAACADRLDQLIGTAREKYGAKAERTLFPVRFFEFAQSTPYELNGQPHLWDMRLQCLVSPGYVEVTPCIIRLCPGPFDGAFAWDSVVSNLTGRDPMASARYLRSPAAHRRSQPTTVLEAIGVDEENLQRLMMGCAQWCEAAWLWSKAQLAAQPANDAEGHAAAFNAKEVGLPTVW